MHVLTVSSFLIKAYLAINLNLQKSQCKQIDIDKAYKETVQLALYVANVYQFNTQDEEALAIAKAQLRKVCGRRSTFDQMGDL